METTRSDRIFDVRGKNAVITGGTQGLGWAMAACLLENGCNVMVVSRHAAADAELERLAEQGQCKCIAYPCDISDTQAVIKMVLDAEAAFGHVDILINSAGCNNLKMIEDMDDDTWDSILDLNLRASFIVTREMVRLMRKRRYGKIINISSMKSVLGVSDGGYTAYCASKGAINMLTKQVACEVAKDGITVNAIAPTFIRTDISARLLDNPTFYESLLKRIPVGRIGTLKDLCGLTLLLASDASQFITGQTILLDGGLAARQ